MPLDAESARLLFQVVSSCYESRSMIFTTNIEFSKWGTVLGDDKLASAMIDRIVHHGRLVEFNGASRRMDAALMLGRARIQRRTCLPKCSNATCHFVNILLATNRSARRARRCCSPRPGWPAATGVPTRTCARIAARRGMPRLADARLAAGKGHA